MTVRSDAHTPLFHRDQNWAQSVRCATTANITIATALNVGDVLDGITLAANDAVLVKDQTTGSQNGLYDVGVTPARSSDMGSGLAARGAFVYVREGTVNGGKLFKNTNTTLPTIDTDALTFAEFASAALTVKDEGGALATAATSIDFVGAGVTASGTGAAKTVTIPGTGWFNVKDYGALGDGTANDTVAIQAAITAATSAGGGTVYFPAGVYIVGGALADTGAFNGQLLLPNVSHSGDHIVITFRGALRPGFHPVFGDTVPLGAGFSVIKSTLTGASGTASCISGGNDLGTTAGGHGNNLEVYVTDLVCLGPDNPTFTFWNLSTCQGGGIDALQISTPGAFSGSPTQPTNTNAYGIKLPQIYFSNYVKVESLSVGGFYTGVLDGELCIHRGLILGPLINGIEFPATFYPSLIVDMTSTQVQNILVGTGAHRLDILSYVAEHATSPAWAVTVYDLKDASGYLYGHARWYNAATGGAPDGLFTVSGGANFSNAQIGALATSSLTVKDEGSSLATAATSIDFVGAGVTASGAGAAKTVTIPGLTATAGQILIADTHSTPLIFADLIQTEAQDDLIYSD